MASLSTKYILIDSDGTKNQGEALDIALSSVLSGSHNPLLMADSREADERPVVFTKPANS